MTRRHSKARRTVTRAELQSLIRSGLLVVDMQQAQDTPTVGALHCRCPVLADVVGICWTTNEAYLRRYERRAWRHALERACTLHLAPRGKRGTRWRPVWVWYRPDYTEVTGGAL